MLAASRSLLSSSAAAAAATTTTATAPPPSAAAELASLERRRDELRARVATLQSHGELRVVRMEQVLLDRAKRVRPAVAVAATHEAEDAEDLLRERAAQWAAKRARMTELSSTASLFRLAGVSLFSVSGRPRDVGVRFDATWGGVFVDRFYVLLSARMRVHRHSLPHFVPVSDLEAAHLPHDAPSFVRAVSRYVTALAARTVEIDKLSAALEGTATVQASEARDVVRVSSRRFQSKSPYAIDAFTFRYGDLLALVPNTVRAEFRGEDGRYAVERGLALPLFRTPEGDFSSLAECVRDLLEETEW